MAETSTKPYMIRALYEWCCDNGYTPYLAVAVDEHTIVPRQHVKGGEIVLNVSPMATSRLTLGNELVEFQARFSGISQQISIPIGNISAIYARETGHGMAFEVPRAPAVTDDDVAGDGPGAVGGDKPDHAPVAHDEGGGRSPSSSVQSLRGGARRRGPRSVDSGDRASAESTIGRQKVTGQESGEVGQAGQDSPDDQAANSRKRASRGHGSADVLEFAPSGGTRKKKSGATRAKSDESAEGSQPADDAPRDDNDEPPPSDGGSQGGKGKARLTRVK